MHEAVRDFYAQHYSANIMKLVLYGRQSLDELEALVRAKFGEVKDKQLQALRPPGAPRGGAPTPQPLRPQIVTATSPYWALQLC